MNTPHSSLLVASHPELFERFHEFFRGCNMELTLGPVLFEWKRDEILKFYEEVSGMEVDRVCLGEVVCVKKKALNAADADFIAGKLLKAGKKAVLSSLAVVSNEGELNAVRELVRLPYPIEANDMSVFNIAGSAEKEVLAGPHITSYNVPSIEFLKSAGVRRLTFPVELSREAVKYNIEKTGIEGEVFAHGKVPLAFSWRCYTSRAHGLTKTECRHHCLKYPDGLEIKSLEAEPLFTVNGTSLLSADIYTLIEFVDDLKAIGVKALRISPQHEGTGKVVAIFRKRIDGRISPQDALEALRGLYKGARFCNGWYLGKAGKDYITGGRAEGAIL